MEIDLEKYRQQFYKESRDILERANTDVLKAESDINNDELLNSLFREVHTIKGSAGSFELWKISEFTHHLEGLLSALRDKKIILNSEMVDIILDSLDYIESLIGFCENGTEFEIEKERISRIEQFHISGEYTGSPDRKQKEETKKINPPPLKVNIAGDILDKLSKAFQDGSSAYYIEINYTDAEFKFGYDPYALLSNIRNNSQYYLCETDSTSVPSFEEHRDETLYLFPKVYCISSLSDDEISDLAFDSSLLKVHNITSLLSIKADESQTSNYLSEIDADILKEFLISMEDIHLSIDSALLEYEKDFSKESINRLFRYIHTIKGDADYIGLKETVELAHNLESFLDQLRKQSEKPDTADIDRIFSSVDEIYENIIKLNQFINRETEISATHKKTQKSQQNDDSAFFLHPDSEKEAFIEQLRQYSEIFPVLASEITETPDSKKNINRLLSTLLKTSEKAGVKSLVSLCSLTLKRIESAESAENAKGPLTDLLSFMEGFISGKPKKLGEILIEENIISPADLQEALSQQKPIGELLVESGKVSKDEVDKALRKQEFSAMAKQLKTGTETHTESATMKIDESKVDSFYNLIGELIVARNTYDFALSKITRDNVDETVKTLKENLYVISRITNDMQRGVMSLRMVSIKTVFQKFFRVVRDIARKQKKDIELVITGEDIEIDKRVADTLSDPLIHIIRNACDHGIETAEERLSLSKPANGTITLKASYEGNHAVIRIADDGKGLNREKIASKAESMGFNTENMSDEEIYNLIFLPGLSTAAQVTDVSGRGVGMDVVLTTAKSLGGFVKIKSDPGKGTETCISIPVSMGVSKALIIEAGGGEFAIPLENVIEAIKIRGKEIHFTQNRLIFYFRGDVLPLAKLDSLLYGKMDNYIDDYSYFYELQKKETEVSIIVLRSSGAGRFAVIVDKLKKNMEIAIKPVPKQLSHIEVISGVTIMGDGGIVQVLNVEGLK